MTALPSPTPAAVSRILGLRNDPRSRAALRRAGSPATERYAYPLLAGLWSTETRPATLLFAGLAAHHYDVPPGSTNLGAAVRIAFEEDRAIQRLQLAQTQTLPAFVITVRRVLDVTSPRLRETGFHWVDLYWMFRAWDAPDPTRRDAARRRLCEQYWRSAPTDPAAPAAEPA